MVTTENRMATADRKVQIPQYDLRTILGVWALAAVPMGAMAWLGTPWLARTLDGPNALARALILSLTGALIWQFIVVLTFVHREQGTLRWPVLKEALWLRAPHCPRTGRHGGLAWLIVIPLIIALAVKEMLPSLPAPVNRDLGLFLESDSGQAFLSGNWVWFAVIVTMFVFNTVLGEELLFRGLLLPRMNGVFGRHDWVANGVLFGLYHVHVPWAIPGALLDTFILAYPAKRMRSATVAIVVHSAQSVVLAVLVLALVLR